MIQTTSQSGDALRQQKTMNATPIGADLELLSLKEVAHFLRLAPISIYRMVAKRLLPVYRVSRRMRFSKHDVLAYLERTKSDSINPSFYGPQD